MEAKDIPPPYDTSFVNQVHGQGQPSPYAAQSPIIVQPPVQPTIHSSTTTSVVIGGAAGSCPVCHNGGWTGTYSCCAWLWCICCFPIGIVCCLCMRKKKCTKCGFTV